MGTIPSSSVSSSELETACQCLLCNNGGGPSCDSANEMLVELSGDPVYLKYVSAYFKRVIPVCGASSPEALWLSSGKSSSMSSSLELSLSVFSISSLVLLTHS
jgi:hypothetical protein